MSGVVRILQRLLLKHRDFLKGLVVVKILDKGGAALHVEQMTEE